MPRPRETCTECSIRRQRCDKNVPCGRCVKRGVSSKCTRIWPDRVLVRSPQSLPPTPAGGTEIIHVASEPAALRLVDPRLHNTARSGTRLSDTSGHQLFASDLAGRSISPSAHRNEGAEIARPSDLRKVGPSPGRDDDTAQIKLLQLEIPSIQMVWQLVQFHERCLLWYHGCYHGPTFRTELQRRIDPQTDEISVQDDLQWSALLFAVLSGSLICANDRKLASWNFRKIDIAKQAARWYQASITCLEVADFTARHSLSAVQAIATLSLSAHMLGFSSKQVVLLGAALRIAQSLGIHRLAFDRFLDTITPESTAEQRLDVLSREIRRRLWSQLCVQDWFSAPSTEAYNINPLFATSAKPGNRDFLTMETIPEHIPTYVSYSNYLNDIARLIAGLQEALASSHTALSQYERVVEFDADMRSLATKGRPIYFDITQQVHPSWQDFVPWARRCLTICFSHKIIMIHRSFLPQSFTNPAFSFTRQTCVAAAKTIINEAKQDNADDGPIIWIDQVPRQLNRSAQY